MLLDPFGRQITYLRISLTDRCNLRCAYCMPAQGLRWIPKGDLLTDDEIVQVVKVAASLGIRKVRFTGGEPLVRARVVQLIKRVATISGIDDLSLTTNATLLEMKAFPLMHAGLKRVNISLDTLDPDRFHRITRLGTFEQAWKGILTAEKAGLSPIKLNAVIVRGFNDEELPALAQMSIDHPWHVRFIEVMPIGNMQNWGEDLPAPKQRYVSVQEMHARLANLRLEPVDQPNGGGPARTYRIPGALGTVGFISPLGEHFCQSCNRLRLTADGKLRSCLVIPAETSLREPLRSGQALEEFFRRAVAEKPEHHDLRAATPAASQRGMSQIGG